MKSDGEFALASIAAIAAALAAGLPHSARTCPLLPAKAKTPAAVRARRKRQRQARRAGRAR